jgi:hypothetical protein
MPQTSRHQEWSSDDKQVVVDRLDWSFGSSPETYEHNRWYEVLVRGRLIATRSWRRGAVRLAIKVAAGKL